VDIDKPSVDNAKPHDPVWPCEAYGEEGLAFGALCFVSGEEHKRRCESPDECLLEMTGARVRVWTRIRQQAAAGDDTAKYLAEQFPTPWTLLGGGAPE
jgi:hypothetical protein